MPQNNSIIQLAEKLLDEDGQKIIEEYLSENMLHRAKIFMLGAIDGLWFSKKISDLAATDAYAALGLPPEESSKFRQSSNRWK